MRRFTAEEAKERAIARSKAWAIAHLQLVRDRSKDWYWKNKEKARAAHKRRADRNLEIARSRAKLWKEANPGRYREWQKNNPEIVNASAQRRRTRKLNAPSRGITAEQRKQILDASLGICAYCNERRKLTLDHIDPIIKGGEHDIENSAACCSHCNSSKGDKPLLIWLALRVA